jgi:hypothetical protein
MLAGWIPACGNLDWKIELPRILFENMQQARRLRERMEELPGGVGRVEADPQIAAFLERIGPADHGGAFVSALFHQIFPALDRAYRVYQEKCDAVFDAPTLYVLRGILAEKRDQLDWARAFLSAHPLAGWNPDQSRRYVDYVQECLRLLGDLTPDGLARVDTLPASPVTEPGGPFPAKRSNDPRLTLRPTIPNELKGNPVHGTLREIVYHDATEWQVIDPMCEIFHGMPGMPFDFFVDFARHIWDECRHSRMGLRRLVEIGFDPFRDFEWCGGGERSASLAEYFLGLTLVGEACSFTRKKGSIPFFLRNGDTRSAMLPEVDCVDEQLHVSFGHKWAPKIFEAAYAKAATKDELAKDARAKILQAILDSPGDEGAAKEYLNSLDDDARNDLVNSFSGFCGAIEFKLDLTVR